ncbi:CK1/TTBKL protein kinase [Aphelenchoides avenae]|nr:CK1/TTBKL protein kinase [Aphelenchus avenae]
MSSLSSNELVHVGQRFGEWKVRAKLDEGGFGRVYRVESTERPGTFAALKAEPNDIEGGSAIKLEIAVLMRVNKLGTKPHVAHLYSAAKRRRYCYMIVTLLGDNLRLLREQCPSGHMRPETWSRLAVQCLYGLKVVHDGGFLHRDIKPQNFVMGLPDDPNRARLLHIIDFGLSRNFVVEKNGVLTARRARGTAEFRGTVRYVAPAVHDRKEQGRRDDIWSLLYMLIELHCGLPWQHDRDKKLIEVKKLSVPDPVLLKNVPEELHPIMPHLRALDCYQRPDYAMIHSCFLRLIARLGVSPTDAYDWERPDQAAAMDKARGRPAEWENAVDFFRSDPLKINGPPAQKHSSRHEMHQPKSNGATMDDNRALMSDLSRTLNKRDHLNAPSDRQKRQ